jgi:hypothetical protein
MLAKPFIMLIKYVHFDFWLQLLICVQSTRRKLIRQRCDRSWIRCNPIESHSVQTQSDRLAHVRLAAGRGLVVSLVLFAIICCNNNHKLGTMTQFWALQRPKGQTWIFPKFAAVIVFDLDTGCGSVNKCELQCLFGQSFTLTTQNIT